MVLKAAAETSQVESRSEVGGDRLTALMILLLPTLNLGYKGQASLSRHYSYKIKVSECIFNCQQVTVCRVPTNTHFAVPNYGRKY